MSRPSRKAVRQIAEELKAGRDVLKRFPKEPVDGRVAAAFEHAFKAIQIHVESQYHEATGDGKVKR